MGQCLGCRRSQARIKDKGTKICGHIQSAVTPLHVLHEETTNQANGHLLTLQEQEQSPSTSRRGSMAMNLTNSLKGLVSKQRNRYKKDGFDLDLTYITDNIIAMGYPASNLEGIYRNHIDDVFKFLECKHKDHYFIYNLCSERSYNISKFHNRVSTFPFDDHNPPKIELIQPFCNAVHNWLTANPKNVAVVHCKAGKGRTGTMICCYLLHSRKCKTPEEALSHYGKTRTQNQKGVTIPSQLRYVNYYGRIINEGLTYVPVSVYIKEIILQPVPQLTGGQGLLYFAISHQTIAEEEDAPRLKCSRLYKSPNYEVKRGQQSLRIVLDCCLPLSGDIKLEVYSRWKLRKEKHFQFWFNTFFLKEGTPSASKSYVALFVKNELDIISKKDKEHKMYRADFRITLYLDSVPVGEAGTSTWPRDTPRALEPDNPSESSGAEESSESEDDDEWDSVSGVAETLDPRGVGYRVLSECELSSSQQISTSTDHPELLST